MNENNEATGVARRRTCPRWSVEERKEWLRLFEESGLSARAFSAQHRRMHWGTLYRWLSEARIREAVDSITPAFVEVQLPRQGSERLMPDWSAELVFGNGKVLRLHGGIPAATLQQLLAAC